LNKWANRLTKRRTRLLGLHLLLRMRLRMVWEQRGVLQNKAAMPPQSLLMTQKGESNGIRLKQ
jgi:hypothetical protein